MSWQATKAVTQLSSFVKDSDFGAFRIMLAIADRADGDGVCGVVGNTKQCLSYNGIAAAARVHRNTVYNIMPKLIESGELEIVEKGGDGRGSWTVYRVTIVDKLSQEQLETSQQIEETSQGNKRTSQQNGETSQAKDVTIDLVTIVERLSQQVERLSQQIEETSQQNGETSQENVTNVTSNGCDGSICVPRVSKSFKKNIYIHEQPELDDEPVHEMITALSAVSKTQFWAKTEDDYFSAAQSLLDGGATPEQVQGFLAWWEAGNRHYTGKPALTSIMTSWKNYIDGVDTRPKAENKIQSAGMVEVAPGVY